MNRITRFVKKGRGALIAIAPVGTLMLGNLAPLATETSNAGYVLSRKNASLSLSVGSTEVKVGKGPPFRHLSGVANKAYAKISLSVVMPDVR